jgi:peroxin-7
MVKTSVNTSGAPLVGSACEIQLHGHEYAVRKVQWSPHRADILASASYDMTCRVYAPPSCRCMFPVLTIISSRWTTAPTPGQTQLLYIHDPHTEFVVGCAWSLYDEGVLASCSWDSKLNVFRI